ncbi:hypothetical protein HZ989_04055 [Brevundimonas sp. AJA228-03]|uniref:hypothetical protein n=1 Tax=Brevundimonas sp. AJA228-03 TaxID=2752515 RepID=UPI001AE0B989|nr:hypothetical protein [Brevundimonas sp. AJA228-03]QTN20251.1 hypothetical protein HZ989_04055 [Brevundimonas sp. AJA228-03]
MKKQTLLGAIALTTLAVGAAGTANAQQYTVVSTKVGASTVSAAATVASEVALTATTSKGSIGLAVTPSASAILPGGNSVLSFTLTGGHTFGTALTPGAIVANGACAPTTTISSGGLATDSTVSFLLSGLGGCTNAVPITALIPAQLASTTTALGVSTTFKTELGTSIDGGSASLANVVKFAPAFKVTTTADTVTTAATLASGFKSLTADVALGTVVVAVTANSKGIDDVTKVAANGDVTKADFKFVGNQTAKTVTLKYDATAIPTTGLLSVNNPVGNAGAITAVFGANDPIPASTYTVDTTLTVAAGFTAPAATGAQSLQSITREGTTYLIPWVSSGTLAGTSGNSTVIRIANIGSAASGAISAELLTSSTGTAASTSLVPLASSIPVGGELVITGQSLQTAIGSNFGRGDIRITAEAQPATLITRRFIQNVASSALTEVSLGRSATGGTEPVN